MAKVEKQDAILDAVQSVIVRDGVRGATMRTVAEEADVSLGLLSYHFDDKGSLILAAFNRASSRLLEASIAAAAVVPRRADDDSDVEAAEERVRAFLRGAFTDEFLHGDYLRLRISLWAVALTDDAVAAVDRDYHDAYARAWSELVARARPDIDPAEVRRRVVDSIAASNGVWLDWARYHDQDDLERGLRLCEGIVLK